MPEGRMRLRWSFAIIVFLTVVFVALPFVIGGGAPPLRDRHSEPAPQKILPMVAVAMDGKLYHDPHCRFIHGPSVLEPAATAIAQGFSPCPRCLGSLRRAPQVRIGFPSSAVNVP